MHQHQGQQGIAEKFMHVFQPFAAPPLPECIAAERQRNHHGQDQRHGQRHQQVLALTPGRQQCRLRIHRGQRLQPDRQALQLAPQHRQPHLTRPDPAPQHTKNQQPGQRVTQRHMHPLPAITVGRQVGAGKAQRHQPVQHACGGVGHAAAGGPGRQGLRGSRRFGGF